MKAVASIDPATGSLIRVREEGNGTVVEFGSIRPSVDGRPIEPGAELLTAQRREDGLYDVETLYAAPRTGPAKVTSSAYRAGWDRAFGTEAN